jgi:hypothetical protein
MVARCVQDQLPALRGLDGVARAIDRKVRNGAQRRELLDQLTGWAIPPRPIESRVNTKRFGPA